MLTWRKEIRGPETVFKLDGDLTEEAPSDQLIAQIQPPSVVLDLAEVRWINSLGVRDWLRLVRALEAKGVDIVLDRCSVPIVFNMIAINGFEGHGRVRSIFVPYFCHRCDKEERRLIQVESPNRNDLLEAVPCPRCRSPMELDDLPELYQMWFGR